MTALQLNAAIYREMAQIADDETLLNKALKALRRITAKKADPTAMSCEEFERMLDRSERDIAEGRGIAMRPDETLDDLLRRVG